MADKAKKGALLFPLPGNVVFLVRTETIKFSLVADITPCYFSDFIKIKYVNYLFFHPEAILERKISQD
jgi:hypothetical protein